MAVNISSLGIADASQTAWIFGAGASVFYGIPTQGEILRHFATMSRPGNAAVASGFDKLRQDVEALCKMVLPGLPMTDPRLSLEEVFSGCELRQAETRSTASEVALAQEDFGRLIEAVRQAVRVWGPGGAKRWRPFERGGVASPYAELIEKLIPPTASPSPQPHIFITFNYDICLDRCLINLRGSPADYDLDYGIPLANARCKGAPPFDMARPGRSILALRTHGSLNWRRCKACQNVFTTLTSQAKVAEGQKCYACGSPRMGHVLVHPTFNRRYDDPLLQMVWGRMFEELVKSDRWVLIGYSLPPADYHFRELLRSCLMARRQRKAATEVILVGRDGPEFPAVVDAYAWLFGRSLRVWNPTPDGFAGFVRAL